MERRSNWVLVKTWLCNNDLWILFSSFSSILLHLSSFPCVSFFFYSFFSTLLLLPFSSFSSNFSLSLMVLILFLYVKIVRGKDDWRRKSERNKRDEEIENENEEDPLFSFFSSLSWCMLDRDDDDGPMTRMKQDGRWINKKEKWKKGDKKWMKGSENEWTNEWSSVGIEREKRGENNLVFLPLRRLPLYSSRTRT